MTPRTRVVEFDYIRVLALIGILLCHSCFEFSTETVWLGRYLGATFNFLFLILSAFLLGSAWERKGYPKYTIQFLSDRIIKLSKSYYIYLAILFIFLYFTQDYFSIRKIVSHIIYLPWFDKINGYGHLWFMTMIVICYISCYLSTKHDKPKGGNILSYSLILGGGICADYFINSLGLPGYIFPYLIGYIIVFRNSNEILKFIKSIRFAINILQFLLINVIGLFLFYYGIFDTYPFVAYLIGMICAISIICFMSNACSLFPQSGIIIWLSGICFEIYLVHEFFLGRYSVYTYVKNPVLGFAILVALSTLASLLIKYLSLLTNGISVCSQRQISKN